MKKLSKFLSLFIGLLTIGLTTGVAYGATSFSNVKEADAADVYNNTNGVYLYFKPSNGWKADNPTFYIHYWGGAGDSGFLPMNKIDGTDYYYYVRYVDQYNFQFRRGPAEWGNYTNDLRYDTCNAFEKKEDWTGDCNWVEKKATIAYDKNGGSGSISDKTCKNPDTITLPSSSSLTKSGYNLVGWEIGGVTLSCGGSYNITTKHIVENTSLTFTAVWEKQAADTYTVTYKANGGTGSDVSDTVEVGATFTTRLANTFTAPSGKKFIGWNTNKDATTALYTAGQSITPSQAKDTTLTLFAIWQEFSPSNGYWIEFFNSPRSPQRVKLTHNGKTDSTSEWTVSGVSLTTADSFKIVRYESEVIPSEQYWGTQYIDDNSNSATAADQIAKKTINYDNNITVSVAGNYDFTFHDYYDLSKLYIDSIKYQVTYHANGGTAESGDYVIHPKVGKDFITEDITKAKFTPPSGQTFKEWNTEDDGSGTAYAVGATVTGLAQDENLDLYAIWKGATYNITYYRVINGTYMDWWGSKTIENVPAGTYYYNLESENIYGFGFDGWYSDQECTVGLSNSQVLENKTVYAKFSSTTDSRQIYAFIPASANYALANLTYGDNHTMSIWMQKDTEHVTKDVHMQKVGDFTSGHLYTIALPNDATGFSFHQGLSYEQMQDGKRSVWLNPQHIGENNMYVFNNSTVTEDNQQRYDGEWKSCYFQFQMSSTDGNWESATKLGMNAPTNMSSGNDAELTNVNVTTSTPYFRVAVVINGTEEPITTTGTDENTLKVVSASGSHQFKNTITLVNVYLKNKTIYLVDAKDIAAGGYLYISTDANPSNIKISVTVTNGEGVDVTPFSHNSITTVSGISTTTTLKYDEVEGMIRIPIFNLRGSTTTLKTGTTYRVTLDGNDFTLDQVTDSSSYWINLKTTTTPVKNTPDALGVKAAFNLDKAILGSKNTSVCNCSQATAQSIVDDFDAADGSSKLPDAEINTYKGTLDSKKGYINIMGPYGQIERIAQSGNAYANNPSSRIHSLSDSEDQTVLIVVIAASATLLATTSALLLLLKKKKKAK